MATTLKSRALILVLIAATLDLVRGTVIRGVALANLPFYNPSTNFSCLDGSRTIAFSAVNDDYCDCDDGTDEPGTSACDNGVFHCINAGYKGENILSNRVNDGVCDCCDGSDEYDDDVKCVNTCREKGRVELEKLKKLREETQKGYDLKVEEMKKGQEKKVENQNKLEELKQMLATQKADLGELQVAKEKAEVPEKEAKDKHQQKWEEEKEAKRKEEEKKLVETAFQNLDLDGNGLLTVQEVASNPYLANDMTEDEAKELLAGNEDITLESFTDIWESVKGRYKENGREEPRTESSDEDKTKAEEGDHETPSSEEDSEELKPPPNAPDVTGVDDTESDKDDDEDVEDDDENDEDKPTTESASPETSSPVRPVGPPPGAVEGEGMPEYDEETKRLMSIADHARNQYDDMNSQVKKTEGAISDLEKALSYDFGPSEEFSYLYRQCYSLDDREYTYRLCPFNEATQSPKGGGSDTSLGTFQSWQGNPNKYTKMKFANGVACWNGPARSTEVTLRCGQETELVSVSEPNRCEYVMEFKTPALCEDPATLPHLHEEL